MSNFCYNYNTQIIYCVVYGYTGCAYWVLTEIVAVDVIGIEKFIVGYGVLMLFMGIAIMIGPPISGKPRVNNNI